MRGADYQHRLVPVMDMPAIRGSSLENVAAICRSVSVTAQMYFRFSEKHETLTTTLPNAKLIRYFPSTCSSGPTSCADRPLTPSTALQLATPKVSARSASLYNLCSVRKFADRSKRQSGTAEKDLRSNAPARSNQPREAPTATNCDQKDIT